MVAALNGFVSLLSQMAWPITLLTIALVFRRDLAGVLGRVGHVKYQDLEVTFRDEIRKAEALAASVPSAPAKPKVSLELVAASDAPDLGGQILAAKPLKAEGGGSRERLVRLASFSPREAVLSAWDEVSQMLLKVAVAQGDRRSPASLRAEDAARFLVDRGWITANEAQLIDRLRVLCERVVHRDDAPSPDEARRFVDLALPVVARLEALA